MRRLAHTLSLSLLAFALLAVPATAQDVSGNWTFTMDTPQGVMTMEVAFAQDGDEVTGEADFAMAEATEISDGLYEDGVLSFLMHLGFEGQWITVEMEADVDGDEMVGEAYVPEMGEGSSFTAKRSDFD